MLWVVGFWFIVLLIFPSVWTAAIAAWALYLAATSRE